MAGNEDMAQGAPRGDRPPTAYKEPPRGFMPLEEVADHLEEGGRWLHMIQDREDTRESDAEFAFFAQGMMFNMADELRSRVMRENGEEPPSRYGADGLRVLDTSGAEKPTDIDIADVAGYVIDMASREEPVDAE